MTTRAAVAVTGVHKSFGSQRVLAGLGLEVPEGAFMTILGASGSGKTTLLRILAGFERPDSGVVKIDGALVDDTSRHVLPERRRVGYVAQEGNLFPHLSVEANVGFGLPRRQRRGRRVQELLETVGLAEVAHRYPHELSGGQQQRVALIRALAIGARVVLLDEPFASLDAGLRGRVRSEVQAILRGAGATTILVTHDQDEALSVSDQVAVVRDGTISQIGTPHSLYYHPADPEVARLLGEVNLIAGIADGDLVETAFGALVLHAPALDGPVTVLVRPEQLEVRVGAGRTGVPGHVLSSGFHGYDAVVSIAPALDTLPEPLTARLRDGLGLTHGVGVTVTVNGAVTAWAATRQQRQPVAELARAGVAQPA